MALLSSSPLLASLFVSYANQAAVFETASTAPPPDELRTLENSVLVLQEDIDRLKPENLDMKERLEKAAASLEAFRSQVASLKEVNVAQQGDIKSLQAELTESKHAYDLLSKHSNAEGEDLRSTISKLEVRLGPCLLIGRTCC